MNNISIARCLNHMAPVQLAEAVGMARQYIHSLENGEKKLGPNKVLEFAEVLGVDPAWLLGHPAILPVHDPLKNRTIITEIIHSEVIPDYGVMYVVHSKQTRDSFAVIMSPCTQFTVTDWQSYWQPMTAAEIADYKWMDVNGNDAVMIDGLPRSIA